MKNSPHVLMEPRYNKKEFGIEFTDKECTPVQKKDGKITTESITNLITHNK